MAGTPAASRGGGVTTLTKVVFVFFLLNAEYNFFLSLMSNSI